MPAHVALVARDLPAATMPKAPNPTKAVGPMYWGLVFAVLLCGVSVVQAHYYFRKYTDKRWLKWIAIAIFICDLLSTTLVVTSVYIYFVPNFGNIPNIWVITPSLAAECIFATLVTAIAQFYFAYQINCIKTPGLPGKVIIWVLGAFGTLSLGFGVVCWTFMFLNPNWVHWALAIQVGFSGCKGFAMLFDIVSTTAMCYYLAKSKSNLQRGTKRVVRILFVFFLQRGALVALIQTSLFAINWAFPGEMYWLTPHLLVTRLYANTFFAMLNSRKYLRNRGSMQTQSDVPSEIAFVGSNKVVAKSLSVEIHEDDDELRDDDSTLGS